jgi:hypothetical protein
LRNDLLVADPDRETMRRCGDEAGCGAPMRASDYVRAVASALNREHASSAAAGSRLQHDVSAYVNVLLFPEGVEPAIAIDADELQRMHVRAVAVPSMLDARGRVRYDPQGVVDVLARLLAEEHG